MRKLLTFAASAAILQGALAAQAPVSFDRARVFRTGGSPKAAIDHRPGVIVRLKTGDASWAEDAARAAEGMTKEGPLVIVEPLDVPPPPAPPSASQPGEATFTGMSFKPLFENDRARVIRARMEVGAREAFHTHASDTVVVHLSGGEIEDTANGKTVVNRWKPGDLEYEARGSSHSSRNVGKAVDVVLVALK